jgi:hypothetical protein
VEARGRDPKGEPLEGEKAKRGSTGGPRLTPAHRERTFRMHKSLKLAQNVPWRRRANSKKGRRVERRGGYREGESSGSGSPGALRHETRPDGCGWNKASRG